MDTESIPIGLIPNYPALCSILNIPTMGGNTKKKHLAELARHVSYTKEGRGFRIKEVYSTVKPKPSRPDAVWSDELGLVLLHKLATYLKEGQDPNEPVTVYLKTYELISLSGLCHPDFYWKRQEYETLDSTDGKLTSAFFNKATSKFSSIFDSVLKGFKRRYSVTCFPAYLYFEIDSPAKGRLEADDKMVTLIEKVKGDALEEINRQSGNSYTSFTIYRGGGKQKYRAAIDEGCKKLGIRGVSKHVKFLVLPSILSRIDWIEKDLQMTLSRSKARLNTSMMDYMGRTMHQWAKHNGRIVFVNGGLSGQQSLPSDMLQYKDMIEGCIKYYQELEGDIE